jgi:DNA-binding NarL/FixJ family response regulator
MRVLIVDDHKLFAEAIRLTLEPEGMTVVIAGTGAEARDSARWEPPDLVLLDVGLPEESGFAVGRDILAEHPDAKILILTSLEDERAVQEAVRSGFHGYLTKDTRLAQFVRAVQSALDGQFVVPQRLARRRDSGVTDEAALLVNQLTPREYEVLSLLAEGANSFQISRTLSISPNTVRTHVQSILVKLQVHSRLEAVAFAARHRVVRGGPPVHTSLLLAT